MTMGGLRFGRVERIWGIAALSASLAGCSGGSSEPLDLTQQWACVSTVYEAENMTHSTGGPTSGGWNIWSNGYIATNHSFAGGATVITVNASGTVAAGQWPHLVLSVGGTVIGSATVNSVSFAPYVFNATIPAGSKEVRVAFDNDYNANGQDRNLLVDKLTIACPGSSGSGGSGGNAGGSGSGGAISGGTGGASGRAGAGSGGGGTSGSGGGGSAGSAGSVSGSASLSYQTDWGSGYCANVTVRNSSSFAASNWALGINLNQAKMSSAWNCQFSASSGSVTVAAVAANAALAPGASATFGFCANATGSNYRPTLGKVSLTVASNGAGGAGGAGGTSAGGGSAGVSGSGLGGGGANGGAPADGGAGGAETGGTTIGGAGTGGDGTSGGAGAGGGGTSGSGGAGGSGGYQPPTGGYVIKSAFLNDPDLAIDHALSTADFYAKAADSQFGGFFTYLDRQGKPTQTNKSFVALSRDAYAFVRAFMLSGDEHYLDLAQQALSFLYAHGWDTKNGGFIFMGDQQGAAQPDPSGSQSPKWSFVQHYGLVGINAMCDATRSSTDCAWLDKGISSLEQHLWDARAGFEGYYNNANLDFSSPRDKGFTPTIDGITTHALNDYLITGRSDYRARFFWLANNAVDHLAASMTAPGVVFGFPEDYNSNWQINTGSKFGFVGHVYKTAWCLARAYLIDPQEKYRTAARQILLQMYQKGGFDRTNGAPNYSFNWDTGVNSTDKEYWQLEQGILSGLYNYAITTSDSDRAIFLEVADRTLDFYVKHLFDTQFGGIFYQTNADGSSPVRTDKGDQWEGDYHDVELSYYTYVDGNLLLWHRPITLYYRFEAASADRDLVLSPIPLRDSRLAIDSVSHAGAPYPAFDAATRSVHLPAGTSGVFAVSFKYASP
jgi:mannose/cellobiose epimerase-like protein (N-acyl-D-glucosamine 2-epimerase family)